MTFASKVEASVPLMSEPTDQRTDHQGGGYAAIGNGAAKQREPVELLLLRVHVHGAEIVFETDNVRLLRELHRRDRGGFLQVCAELQEYGVSRDDIMDAISPGIMKPASPEIMDAISEDSDIDAGVGAYFGVDGVLGLVRECTIANEPQLSEATRALLADLAALRQLGREVALAPRTQRLEAFTAVAREATKLVLAGAIKKADAVDQLIDIAWAHGCNRSHIRACERIVRAAFAKIGANP
jgi:hypothetical protein